MELTPGENFSYTQLDDDTKAIVLQRISEIKGLMRLTAENIINIGQKLTEVKEQLGHGSFQNWLQREFEWSEQTARQFMQVYRWSKTVENKNFVFSQMATSALYLLAAPSTPNEVREEVMNLVEEGEKISYTQAKDIIQRHKTTASLEATEVDAELAPIKSATSNTLFRLEIGDFGCIVRLYRRTEIEVSEEMAIGSLVRILVGRWQGYMATVTDILQEQDVVETKESVVTLDSVSTDVPTVKRIEPADFFNADKRRSLFICHNGIYLAIDADADILQAFFIKIENDSEFVTSIFCKA